jgi:hypothetical protein
MNIIKMVMAFAPWIVFALLAGNSLYTVKIAIIASLAVAVILGYKDLRAGFILSWATFTFFIFLVITVVFMTNLWILEKMNVLVYVTLAAVTWIGIIIGRPFVMEYARQEVDESRWQDPRFIRVVRNMTGFWGVAFLADLGIAIYQTTNHDFMLKIALYLVMLIAMMFTLYYPRWVRARYAQG